MSTIIAERTVKARKDHKCFGCLKVIPKGMVHQADATVDCGVIFTCRMCDECLERMDLMDDDWDQGIMEGEFANLAPGELP